MNGSLTTTELKRSYPSRPVRGAETWNELVPHPRVMDKNSGGISWEQGVPRYREGFDGCQMREGCKGMDEEVRGLRSTNR